MADEHGTADWPIRHALDRLVAQDRWELPYADAAREALDRLAAREQTLRRERNLLREALQAWYDSGFFGMKDAPNQLTRAALAADAQEQDRG